ncbi:MAG: hypothetical protein HY914_01890 [Desulfomonile tiedjei]|nr:hypothetical protein [Desulfomonile tiedjei]
MSSRMRAALAVLGAWLICSWIIVGNVSVCSAQTQPSTPAVGEVQFVPEVPRTGDKLQVKIQLTGEAVRAELTWSINGQEVARSDYYGDGKPVVFDKPLKADDTVLVSITPFDGGGDTGRIIEKKVLVRKALPEIKLLSQSVQNQTYVAKVEASDPEGGPIKLILEQGPDGMKLDENGNIEWKLNPDISGKFTVKVKAQDERSQATVLTYEVTIRWQK